MGKVKGFLEIPRKEPELVPVPARIKRYEELVLPMAPAEVSRQGARCMDCGIPFCHDGCPVNNVIPDWNDLVYRGKWRQALEVLQSTNNFPEFTGRVCPAPCEAACTLNINDQPVTIKTIEQSIADRGWQEGWIVPKPASKKTGKHVAVVGSGPAGLACAQELARSGHEVTVFEKHDRPGGLLRYGIPDFKLEKRHVDRRIEQMQAEGVVFRTGVHVGVTIPAKELLDGFDAVVLAGGSEAPRALDVPGRDLGGIHYAMEYLTQQNKVLAGDRVPGQILATGKDVVVLGGGDTGSDCIGTAVRQGARSVTNFELLPEPPQQENKSLTWPYWPMKLRTSSSHAEGCTRDFAIATKGFSGKDGRVEVLHAVRLAWNEGPSGALRAEEIPGSAFDVPADLVLLALGYLHPVRAGMLEELGVELDARGNVKADTRAHRTSNPKVFAAGDMRRGQSLVVWAIREGRDAARAVNGFLRSSPDR
ncbi:glutamate synthase subunit beta [Polyangium spumosum]|uniref:Glutamate synthase small subunit n=1 Tax=Polyangium spumosum TaxID=889282 RepID=A0A6N7PZN9_9BACT|nr:glutamate synthase subunit beta [Polyangium spumosum]MRG97568.1 glutamate synthase small subunit [Polyangium spumosum]